MIAIRATEPRGAFAVMGATTILLLVVFGMLLAVAWLGPSRMTYTVGAGRLRVETIFSSSEWPLSSLRARAYSPSSLWRVGGTAMPGYYTGRYRSEGEPLRVYATDVRRGVLITGSERVFVTPSDEAGFFEALRAGGARVDEAPGRAA